MAARAETIAFDDETGTDDYAALFQFLYRQPVFARRQAVFYGLTTVVLFAAYLMLDIYIAVTIGPSVGARSLAVDAVSALPWAVVAFASLFALNRWLVLPGYCRRIGRLLVSGWYAATPAAAMRAVPSSNRLDLDGLYSHSPGYEMAMAWPLVRRLVETGDHLLLMTSDSTGAVFRKAALAPALLDDFRAMVAARAGRGGALTEPISVAADFVFEVATTPDDVLAGSDWAARRKAGGQGATLRRLRGPALILACMALRLVVGAGGVSSLVPLLRDTRDAAAIVGLLVLYALVFVAWRWLARRLTRSFQRRIAEDFRRGSFALEPGEPVRALRQTIRLGEFGVEIDAPGLRVRLGWPLIAAFGEDAERFFFLSTLTQVWPLPKLGVAENDLERLRQYAGARVAVPQRPKP